MSSKHMKHSWENGGLPSEFPCKGIPQARWMVCKGKAQSKMDDDWVYASREDPPSSPMRLKHPEAFQRPFSTDTGRTSWMNRARFCGFVIGSISSSQGSHVRRKKKST